MDKEDYLPLPAVNGFHERFDNGKSHIYFAFLIIISFIRCRSHTQKQFRIEIINDLSVNIVRTVVSLIQNNAIKGIWLILKQMCISVQSLYCCKNIILLIFIEACSHQAHCHFLIKNFFKRFFSLLRKCYTMNQKQYSFETKLTHSKRRCIGLSCSRICKGGE